jgi:hypothetical protein
MTDTGCVGIAGEGVQDEDGVGTRGIQLAIRFVRDVDRTERDTAIEL